jgi:hypothetical protein
VYFFDDETTTLQCVFSFDVELEELTFAFELTKENRFSELVSSFFLTSGNTI